MITEKVQLVALAPRVADVVVVKQLYRGVLLTLLLTVQAHTQLIPESELQVNLNTYFDSFDVQVIYPSFSYTQKLSDNTSINARYLVDLITAASIRSSIVADNANVNTATRDIEEEDDDFRQVGSNVDAVTAASGRGGGGGYLPTPGYNPDDVRQEIAVGATQTVVGGVTSLHGLYSRERDYRSGTIAGTFTRSFFMNNTTVQLGFVRSWDASFPTVFNWTKNKDTHTFSVNLTQVWTKKLISQSLYSYIDESGYLSNPYEVVTIKHGGETQHLQPVSPNQRIRQALATNVNYKLNRTDALHLGIRYYWDDWDVRSVTSSLGWYKHLNDISTIHFGVRHYDQSRAYFFKKEYTEPETYMTVDSKLDRSYSNRFEFQLTLQGHDRFELPPLLRNDNIQFDIYLGIYQRHTATPNWFSSQRNLFAFLTSFGVRYTF